METQSQDQQNRLHHRPFLALWVVSFGVAWLGVFFTAILLSDIFGRVEMLSALRDWLNSNNWLYGLMLGAGLGSFLALVQPWLMRWRYGFVPRFWRHSTIIGAMIAGSLIGNSIFSGLSSGFYS